jgi:hypothetical protein
LSLWIRYFVVSVCTQNVQFVSQTASSRFIGNVTDMSVLRPFSTKHGHMPGAFLSINPNPFSKLKSLNCHSPYLNVLAAVPSSRGSNFSDVFCLVPVASFIVMLWQQLSLSLHVCLSKYMNRVSGFSLWILTSLSILFVESVERLLNNAHHIHTSFCNWWTLRTSVINPHTYG